MQNEKNIHAKQQNEMFFFLIQKKGNKYAQQSILITFVYKCSKPPKKLIYLLASLE